MSCLGHIERTMRERLIGQDAAIATLLPPLARYVARMSDPRRPALTALLLGPTGVGKTETARALARAIFGSDDRLTIIRCEEYVYGHNIAKLIGSPPGYVGYQIEPLLTQSKLEAVGRGATMLEGFPPEPFSIVLFDEIEKAHADLWHSLIGLLEDATVMLANNQPTLLARAAIFLTSNVGSAEVGALLGARRAGFGAGRPSSAGWGAVAEAATEAARRTFPAEFLNRLDVIQTYGPLSASTLAAILDRLLVDLHERLLAAGIPLVVNVTPAARRHLVERGTDPRYGARPLRRALERELVDALAQLVAAGYAEAGAVVDVGAESGVLTFEHGPLLGVCH